MLKSEKIFSQPIIPIFHHSKHPYVFLIWHLNFDIWILVFKYISFFWRFLPEKC
jgi:hypothetical protein